MGLSLDPLPGVQMAQLQKSLLAGLLLVLLSSSFTSAGYVSPGNSVYVGTSPTLRYLLACGHLATKPPYLSTHDIYSVDQVAKGLRNLQAAMGLAQTGVEGEEERRVIKKGKCINNSPKSIKIAPASKPVQTVNPFVEVFAPPARYDSPSVEVFAPSSPSSRPSAPYVEHKKVKKVKKAYSGCGVGLYGVGLRALSSCGSTFLSCFAGRSHLLHCPPGTRFSPQRGLCTWPASVPGCRL